MTDQDQPLDQDDNNELDELEQLSAEIEALDIDDGLDTKEGVEEALQQEPEYIKAGSLEVAQKATINIQRTEKPHSYSWRYGGAGTDGKVYYDTPEELAQHFEQLAEVQ